MGNTPTDMQETTNTAVTADDIIAENRRRQYTIHATFDPITGQGSVGERTPVTLTGYPIHTQWLPITMLQAPLVTQILGAGGIAPFLTNVCHTTDTPEHREQVIHALTMLRCLHDFPFWAASFVYIKRKGGGDDCLFRLTRPQRRFVQLLESQRLAGKPIRVVLLKARQWGGSTTSQIYMAWLQLVHRRGLGSLIIAQQASVSEGIRDMFLRLMSRYPAEMLPAEPEDKKIEGVGRTGTTLRVPARNCKITLGTAERPDSCRGGDYSLVHLSEVGLWRATEGKRPEDIVRSACSGILLQPYTMIVYESTANGTGNFFQQEYDDAKNHRSQFLPLFIAWHHIDQYSMPIPPAETHDFATRLLRGKNSDTVPDSRHQSGRYLYYLWRQGATLEAINWYIHEREKYNDHSLMASEYPTDDTEAFVNSGANVFDREQCARLRATCHPPTYTGELTAQETEGPQALSGIHFTPDTQGALQIWEQPEHDEPDTKTLHRYLAVVDIGGRSRKADWSVIAVFDRIMMQDTGRPVIVAQWYGHDDIDRVAWRAAQIATYYHQALLVIESNTLETHDPNRIIEGGDQSQYILQQIADAYPNLYTRRQSEDEIRQHIPRRYGFHTNTATKPMVISTLVRAIRDRLYTERDERCIDEYLTYEQRPNGSYAAIAGKHDDLLMTRAIGLHVCFHDMPMPVTIDTTPHTRRIHIPRTTTEATIA